MKPFLWVFNKPVWKWEGKISNTRSEVYHIEKYGIKNLKKKRKHNDFISLLIIVCATLKNKNFLKMAKFIFESEPKNELIVTDIEIFGISNTVKNLIDDFKDLEKQESVNMKEIPLPQNISYETMEKVVRFCTKFRESPFEIKNDEERSFCYKEGDWYKEFIEEQDQNSIFSLVTASNYFDIQPLLNLSLYYIAQQLSKRSVDEIREYFGIESNFTPEEEEKIKQELAWALT